MNYFSLKKPEITITNSIDFNVIDLLRNKRKFTRNYLQALKAITTINSSNSNSKRANRNEFISYNMSPMKPKIESISISKEKNLSNISKLKTIKSNINMPFQSKTFSDSNTPQKPLRSFAEEHKKSPINTQQKFPSLIDAKNQYDKNKNKSENCYNTERKNKLIKNIIEKYKFDPFQNLNPNNAQYITSSKKLKSLIR